MIVDIHIQGDPERIARFLKEMGITQMSLDGSINLRDSLFLEFRREASHTEREELLKALNDISEDVSRPSFAHGMENFPIKELDLGVRIYNVLRRGGIETIGDIVSKTEDEIAMVPNFGKSSIEEIKAALKAHGLQLRDKAPSKD